MADTAWLNVGINGAWAQSGARVVNRSLDSIKRTAKTATTAVGNMKTAFVGLAGVAATLGIAVGIKEGLSTLRSFGKAMSEVKAITGATGNTMQELTNISRELGATTTFTATDAAKALRTLGMAGFTAKESMAAVPGVLKAAQGASIELAQSADIVASTIRMFGLEAKESDRVVNVLAATITSANTDAEMWNDAMKYIGATSAALNVSLEETSAVIAKLADNGLRGSMATASLATQIQHLAKPTKDAKEEMERLGLHFFDSQGNFVGYIDMVRQLEKAYKTMTPEQKAASISAIFGSRAFKQVALLVKTGADNLEEYTKSITGTNKATRMFMDTMDNLDADIKTLLSAFEDLVLALGDAGVTAALRDTLLYATEFVRAIADIENYSVMTTAALHGLSAVILVALIPAIVALGTAAQTAFGFLSGPLAALFVVVTAISAAWQGWNEIIFATSYAAEALNMIFVMMGKIGTMIYTTIATWASKAWLYFLETARGVIDRVAGFFGNMAKDLLSSKFNPFAQALGSIFQKIETGLRGAAAETKELEEGTKKYLGKLQRDYDKARDKIIETAGSMKTLWTNMSTLQSWIDSGSKAIVGYMGNWTSLISKFGEVISKAEVVQGAIAGINSVLIGPLGSLFFGEAEGGGGGNTKTTGGGGGGKTETKKASDMIAELQQQVTDQRNLAEAMMQSRDAYNAVNDAIEVRQMLKDEDVKATDAEITQLQQLTAALREQETELRIAEEIEASRNMTREEGLRQAQSLIDENKTSHQKLADELERINDLLPFVQERFMLLGMSEQQAAAAAEEVHKKATKAAREGLQEIAFSSQQVESVFVNGFTNMIASGQSFRETLRNIGNDLLRMAANAVFKKIFGGLFDGLFGSANGNAFSNGRVVAMAAGGIVNSPTIFPMANGMGLMGEAGPEAVMPLKRLPNGKLGVYAEGGSGGYNITNNVTINAQSTGDSAQDKEFARMMGDKMGDVLDMKMAAFVNKHQRPGGMLYQGAR